MTTHSHSADSSLSGDPASAPATSSPSHVTDTATMVPPHPSTTPRVLSPVSPSYPPYGYIDPSMAYEIQANGGYEHPQTYVFYPVSPQFYYSDYPSYPGSPALHPQSPPMNPTSPPFSPTYQYHTHPQGLSNGPAANPTLSPTAYMLPPHSMHPPFPPLHISSPVLTPVGSSNRMVNNGPPSHYYESRKQGRHPHHSPTSSANSTGSQDESPLHQRLNVYVRGLSPSTTDESFLELCKAYGTVTSSKAILDQKSGECKGYGFAMYDQDDECRNAIQGLNNAGLQASHARVGQESFSSRLRNLQDEYSTNIYISNLPLDMTEQKLEEVFHPLQTVSNRILRDPQTGISRGVGFARMLDRHSAMTIIEKFNGHEIDGSSAPLQVRFADSPAQKKLKNQTSRKRVIRSRDFQSMTAPFPMRHMPVTPETMLGIAPASYQVPPPYNTMHMPMPPLPQPNDHDISDLTSAVEKDLKITEPVSLEHAS
ncbi:hypothetical protein DM01DRAFT_1408500 [Hesseltinella vesiculosa]|uniref:RRM domain-containing protein n=1 Tax=Hesseltinella vesiculosa TaxID=101127 RepID=A0A1X2GES6_9FUNG|nr:hypothetical protein DM01DRAFT_1408500 [Hesseltinella vesiculosa]